jgi:alkylated DNA repair dioxygenase AlkB
MTFTTHKLSEFHTLLAGHVPQELLWDANAFNEIWESHPEEFPQILIHGKLVATPRWQQSYGRDYHYSGQVNKALPITPRLMEILDWSKKAIDLRLNGILINWYSGPKHYIGKHRDSIQGLVVGAPIVTISYGQSRTFRIRPFRGEGTRDFLADNGCVFVMPFETNASFYHEVPKSARNTGRRISVTLRAFED